MPPAPERFRHFVAIDWSGAVGPRQRGIAVAACTGGDDAPRLIRPAGGWSRAGVREWLRTALPADALVGFDLGPSLPFIDQGAYFPGWSESPADARSLWAMVDRLCTADPHLAATSFVDHPQASRYFRRHGGRAGDRFGTGRGRLRVTEIAQQRMGLAPCSNLNLVGAAQVGKSSLTGMRLLHRLGGALPVWPFDEVPVRGSVIVEIYTSLAALAAGRPKGRAKMRSSGALDAALVHPAIASEAAKLTDPLDDHTTDAVLSAAWLRAVGHMPALWTPPGLTSEIAGTEGWTFGVV